MDINALRVFNALHSLSISEEEFALIESEQGHTERTGLFIVCIKKGQSICISHDENHKIIIKNIKAEFPTPCRVLFKTVITFDDLPPEVYTLHSIAQYRTLDADIKHRADNLDELKDRICDRFVDNNPKNLGESCDSSSYSGCYSTDQGKKAEWKDMKTWLIDSQLHALFWLFNEDYQRFERDVKVSRDNIARIVKVFERNNRRLAIIQRTNNYQKKHTGGCMSGYGGTWDETIQGSELMIRCFRPKDVQYNYVDLNREIYLPVSYSEDTEIWLDDTLFEKIGHHELKVLSKRLFADNPVHGRRWILLNADEFNKKQSLIRIEVMSAARKDQEEQAKKSLAKNIDTQFKKGKVVRQGITFTKNSIECEGIKIKNQKLGEFVMKNQVHLQLEPDFRRIVQDFICYILNIQASQNFYSDKISYVCNFVGDETIDIGKVKLHIKSENNNIFINNSRIRKDDLVEVIFKALSYTDQTSFDAYLAYSASVNLALQKTLASGGMSFELKIDITEDNSLPVKKEKMLLSLPLKRVKGKNYTTINGVDYRIQNLQAFFDIGKEINGSRIGYSGGGYLQRTIKMLYRAIKDISPKDIGDLIRNGEKEYATVQAHVLRENAKKSMKADEFVKHAAKVSKAKELKDGFLVHGASGKTYTVNARTLAVYEILPGKKQRYICIVDMETPTNSEWGRKDALAKRLLMLSHDLKVADQVHTLGLTGQEPGLEVMA
nr:MAG: hypothetical protein OI861_00250 [Candidatus Methanoperedens sp.]